MKEKTMSEYTSIVLKMVFVLVSLFTLTFCIGNAYAIDKEFRKCAGCHKIAEGKKGGMGPNLWGVFGSKSGQVEGYRYSDYLKNADITWDRKSLQAWLSNRQTRIEYFGEDVKNTKMMWTGIKKEEQMKEILDYLEKMK